MITPRCRLCSTELTQTFVDLGMSPPCESYLSAEQLDQGEVFYPLHVRVCSECLLVQLPAYIPAEDIFSHYAYFSSYCDSWVAHARRFVESAVSRLGLDQRLVRRRGGEQRRLSAAARRRGASARSASSRPATSPRSRVDRGIPTEVLFLGEETGGKIASEHGRGRPRRRQQRVRPRARHRRLRQGACARWSPTADTSASRSRTCCG